MLASTLTADAQVKVANSWRENSPVTYDSVCFIEYICPQCIGFYCGHCGPTGILMIGSTSPFAF